MNDLCTMDLGLKDSIAAISTAPGTGAIALVRLSGDKAIELANIVFDGNVLDAAANQAIYGRIVDGQRELDDVLLTVFKAPKSFTGEDVVEIACHGSPYIQQSILQLLIEKGARTARPGEFTQRAFLNGKMDLSQAEAVADLIASGNEAAHRLAMQQMRGGFSKEINELRQQLMDFASLIELELDFSEEDVEFADRKQLFELIDRVLALVEKLRNSFSLGNAIKTGIPVAIVGEPNVGKSTLLNALLKDDRAIVSDIAGTTRDTIEDEVTISGIGFRFIDTAGIRETVDEIEGRGIERTFQSIEKAQVVILMLDANGKANSNQEMLESVRSKVYGHQQLIVVNNKSDLASTPPENGLAISALNETHVAELEKALTETVDQGLLNKSDVIVTNARHYEALVKAHASLSDARAGLDNNLTGDLLAIDIRKALHHLGEITGQITTDDLLGNIFSRFCIGK